MPSINNVADIFHDPYTSLGVRPFINCCGTRTVHGGSLILPEVRVAMGLASLQFVNMNELMERARIRIAELTGAEDGIVTAGSAAAIAIATAAAIAGNDPVRMLRLPKSTGTTNQVVMLNTHRFPYDQAIRMVGAQITEVDHVNQLTQLNFKKVAMIVYLGARDKNSAISLETFVAAGRHNGIPVLVDAASEHISRPNPWLIRGADLVVYSGGKALRGPQTSGLLLGRRDLIDSAWANSPPHRAFGRPMKFGKEDVVGILAALELWFSRDPSIAMQSWIQDLETIVNIAKATPSIETEIIPPEEGDQTPQIRINWDYNKLKFHGTELRRQLLAGTPRILIDDITAGPGTVTIDIFSLHNGEAKTVADAIVAILNSTPVPQTPSAQAEIITGKWVIDVHFPRFVRTHKSNFHQTGTAILGKQRSPGFATPINGTVNGIKAEFSFEGTYEGAIITYHFTGLIQGNYMSGEVIFGSTTTQTRGVVSYNQYGKAQWDARRL